MRAQFQKIHLPLRNTYSVKNDNALNLSKWHYHDELELHYIIKGSGKRFIGHDIGSFSAGEIILIGEQVPHKWQFDEHDFESNSNTNESIVLHFGANCLGSFFLALPEAHLLSRLMDRAKSGMMFYGATNNKLAMLMKSSVNSTRMDRIVILLSILSVLSETEDYHEISTKSSFTPDVDLHDSRHSRITDFIIKNYQKDIGLEHAAAISNMSITSFCRYFKILTNKTFNEFLQEVRIGHACRMIIENKYPIGVICFECGFKNVSNFYRHFKSITGMTPKEYNNIFIN
ncbi:AraC family transcriptional regulator [Pedobacter sp.]|uniref:AraC family transcriptional regulator n=1 Tax=Pedobacter sp. TaxID=1411316 RepID=UPI003BAB5B74